MDPTPRADDLVVDTLADALGIGLDLIELMGQEDFCAVWLGSADGTMLDCVICTDESGRDVDALVGAASVVAGLLAAERTVLWRSVDDIGDPVALAESFFEHGSVLNDAGVQLVDEIVISGEALRSMAVTSFTDEEGWDDVTARLEVGGEEWRT